MSKNAQQIISPVGELQWCFINGSTTKNLKGEDIYAVALVLPTDSDACKEFIATIEEYWEEWKPKGCKKRKSAGFHSVTDENDEPTGFTSFQFWTGLAFPDGKEKKIIIKNAKGAEVFLGDKKIGNGSRGRVGGAMDIYDTGTDVSGRGITLYLNALQLSKFIEFTGAANFDTLEDEDGDNFDSVEDDGMGGMTESEQSEESTPKPRL